MDKDRDGDVTWEEFKDFNKKMASLLQPAFFSSTRYEKENYGWKILGQIYQGQKTEVPKAGSDFTPTFTK